MVFGNVINSVTDFSSVEWIYNFIEGILKSEANIINISPLSRQQFFKVIVIFIQR